MGLYMILVGSNLAFLFDSAKWRNIFIIKFFKVFNTQFLTMKGLIVNLFGEPISNTSKKIITYFFIKSGRFYKIVYELAKNYDHIIFLPKSCKKKTSKNRCFKSGSYKKRFL